MKKIVVLLMALVLCFSLAACATSQPAQSGAAASSAASSAASAPAASAASGKVDIGIVLPTKDEPRWLQDEARFKDLISKTNYKVEVLFSQKDSSVEKNNVEALISKGIKVLIICPQDAAAAAAAAEAASAAGVKVISYDRLITGTSKVDYYVEFDSVAVGKSWGDYLISKATGKSSNLYLYAGAATDNNAFLFFQGAWSALQPKIADGTFVIKNSSEAVALQSKATLTRDEMAKIIGQVTTNWDFNEAKSKAEANLTAAKKEDKGTCYVCAPNDGTARAIADAFKADANVSKYFITGQDAEVASVQYIIDGKQSMTVFKDTRVLAKNALDMAIAVIESKTPTTDSTMNNGKADIKTLNTKIIVITADNVKKELVDSGYYTADKFQNLK